MTTSLYLPNIWSLPEMLRVPVRVDITAMSFSIERMKREYRGALYIILCLCDMIVGE